MTNQASIRGAAAVGYLTELEPLEAAVVLYLRMWWDGPCTRQQVRDDLAGGLGPVAGREALNALEQLCGLCVRHGRRALMRHQPSCKCVGGDEACFANLVTLATEGEHEDALLIATLLVRQDVSSHLASLAQTFGLGLRRLQLGHDHRGATVPATKLH